MECPHCFSPRCNHITLLLMRLMTSFIQFIHRVERIQAYGKDGEGKGLSPKPKYTGDRLVHVHLVHFISYYQS